VALKTSLLSLNEGIEELWPKEQLTEVSFDNRGIRERLQGEIAKNAV